MKIRFSILMFIFSLLLMSCSSGNLPFLVRTTPTSPPFSSESGAIQAKFHYWNGDRPVRGQLFYLAELLPVEGELTGGFVPALDTTVAPRAESNDLGEVLFTMVPPGRYALAFMTPIGPILVNDEKTNKEILVDVEAEKLIDLGYVGLVLEPDQFEVPD